MIPTPHPTFMKGDALTLNCKVTSANYASEIKWKKNGGLVPSKAVSKENDKVRTLVIKNVDTDYSGSRLFL